MNRNKQELVVLVYKPVTILERPQSIINHQAINMSLDVSFKGSPQGKEQVLLMNILDKQY